MMVWDDVKDMRRVAGEREWLVSGRMEICGRSEMQEIMSGVVRGEGW